MIRKCGTSSTTIVQEQETRNQPENTNQTGCHDYAHISPAGSHGHGHPSDSDSACVLSSIGRRFLNRPPGSLTIEETCDLFVDHFDKNVKEEDRLECIEKLKEERITGKYLVSILDNAQKLDKLYKTLKFRLPYEECFIQMVEFIRSRHAHFGGSNTQKIIGSPVQNKNANPTSCEPKENTQASTSAASVTGFKLKARDRLDAKFDEVNIPDNGDHIVGVDIDANDDAKVNAKIINGHITNDKRFLNRPLGGLTTEETCDLFVDHLYINVKEEDQLECIEKIKEERITGKYLVSILDDEQKLDKLYKKLKFRLPYEECFIQMIEFLRSSHAHFGGSSPQKIIETPLQNKKANPISCEPKENTRLQHLLKVSLVLN